MSNYVSHQYFDKTFKIIFTISIKEKSNSKLVNRHHALKKYPTSNIQHAEASHYFYTAAWEGVILVHSWWHFGTTAVA